jgi:hypothetical protein
MKYEKKGETPITLPEFSNLWVTGNDRVILHISHEDRRQLVYEASEAWLKHLDKFVKLAEELKDLDTCKAWFDFFMTRDLTGWSPKSNPPSDAKAKTILECGVKSHFFIAEFFAEDNWFEVGKPTNIFRCNWIGLYEILSFKNKKDGETFIRMDHKRLYQLYRFHMKQAYPSSTVRNSDTFFNELEKVGIVKYEKRRKINNRNKTCCDIVFSAFKKEMKTLYPTFNLGSWFSVDNPKLFQKGFDKYGTQSDGFI